MAAKGFRGAGMAREFPTLAHIIAMGGNQDETRGRPGIPIIRNRHHDSAPSSWRHHYVYGVAAAVAAAAKRRVVRILHRLRLLHGGIITCMVLLRLLLWLRRGGS